MLRHGVQPLKPLNQSSRVFPEGDSTRGDLWGAVFQHFSFTDGLIDHTRRYRSPFYGNEA